MSHLKDYSLKNNLFKNIVLLISLSCLLISAPFAFSIESIKQSHGFALYGDLKYPSSFTHLDYVNPAAPKGGQIKLMGFGTFDTLNPYTLKGISPINTPGQYMYGFSEETDSLLAGTEGVSRSGDEPQSAYGLIAESVSYPIDIRWAIFKIRDIAQFQDGHKIDADDVLFSWHTLIKNGHPQFRQKLKGIESVSKIDEHSVKVTFKQANSGADLLRFGEMPILPEHYWKNKDFSKTILTPPLISGPYKIESLSAGKYLVFVRNTHYWARNLPILKGRYNFDKVQFDYYRDQTVAFEGFKSSEFDAFIDYTAKNWAAGYNFPALLNKKVIKAEIPHHIPSGTQGLFFNTRKTIFNSVEVREAISLLFDFEWTNRNIFHNAYTRNNSYFPNSVYDSSISTPDETELVYLTPYANELPAEFFKQPFSPSQHPGNGSIRKQLKKALNLFKQAGWTLKKGILYNDTSNQPFKFEILLRQAGMKRVIEPFIENLRKAGIQVTERLVDANQYKVRLDNFDYDMTTFVLSQSLSPSHEQRGYFHSSTVNIKGSRNYAGIAHPVVDSLTEKIIRAKTREELISATKALDRVLLWNHYIIPNWHLNYHRIAYWDRFKQPENQPPYTLGFETWWAK
jgi:microcin C transport system substrate-binding protein